MDDKRMWVETLLEKGFTPINPVKPMREGPRNQQPIPYVSSDGNSMDGFPDFATQSMEALLNTEGMVAQNVHNTHGFEEGFLGFEEFSGWDGFDINNM